MSLFSIQTSYEIVIYQELSKQIVVWCASSEGQMLFYSCRISDSVGDEHGTFVSDKYTFLEKIKTSMNFLITTIS